MTTNPEPIPTRLINTCRKVYVAVDMPKIMLVPFHNTMFFTFTTIHLFRGSDKLP